MFLATRDGDFSETTPGAVILLLLVVGVPLAVLALVIRALYRVGQPRPEPVVFVVPPQWSTATAPPTTLSPTNPPSGWYNNPDGDGERWWDGQGWAEQTRHPPSNG